MPEDQLRKAALDYHRYPVPGKIAVTPTKGLVNQRDLALAYTPGVAKVCEEIAAHPAEASNYTARGNLVIRSTGKVKGMARYKKLAVEEGGQIVGSMNEVKPARRVVMDMVVRRVTCL